MMKIIANLLSWRAPYPVMFVYKSICFASPGFIKDSGSFTVCLKEAIPLLPDFANCHDDYELNPADGVLPTHTYKWLGFVFYVHVSTGLVNLDKAPRVVLVHKQFVLGTASDLILQPKNYRLGNVVFGDYESDEDECRLTSKQIKDGLTCQAAYFQTRIINITPHPEYTRFGVANSLALGKLVHPLPSEYMLPICLPSLDERRRLRRSKKVHLIDYLSSVPLDLQVEKMAKRTLKLYTHNACRRHNNITKYDVVDLVSNSLCTTGCGIRSGAVIISHDADGMFQLIGVSVGGVLCLKRSMRTRFNSNPPLYIDVYPYNTWITSVVNAYALPSPYPMNFQLSKADLGQPAMTKYYKKWKGEKLAWRGHTFVAGNSCFRSSKRHSKIAFFYYEKFTVVTLPRTRLKVFMKISAGVECTITCARLYLPNHKTTPVIDGLGSFNISIQFQTDLLPYNFQFTLRLSGRNSTSKDIDTWWSQRGTGLW